MENREFLTTMTSEEFIEAAAVAKGYSTAEDYTAAVAAATVAISMNPDELSREELVAVIQRIALLAPPKDFLDASIKYAVLAMSRGSANNLTETPSV